MIFNFYVCLYQWFSTWGFRPPEGLWTIFGGVTNRYFLCYFFWGVTNRYVHICVTFAFIKFQLGVVGL